MSADKQTQMLWQLMSEISRTHQTQLLIDMFGETEVAAVFKEDYEAWKEEKDEDEELDIFDPNRCIDCDDDVRKKSAFWGCEQCGLTACVDCCNNDNGYVLCAKRFEEGGGEEEKEVLCV